MSLSQGVCHSLFPHWPHLFHQLSNQGPNFEWDAFINSQRQFSFVLCVSSRIMPTLDLPPPIDSTTLFSSCPPRKGCKFDSGGNCSCDGHVVMVFEVDKPFKTLMKLLNAEETIKSNIQPQELPRRDDHIIYYRLETIRIIIIWKSYWIFKASNH